MKNLQNMTFYFLHKSKNLFLKMTFKIVLAQKVGRLYFWTCARDGPEGLCGGYENLSRPGPSPVHASHKPTPSGITARPLADFS